MVKFEELDVIKLTKDVPEHRLVNGQVGTILLVFNEEDYEVEIFDDNKQTNFVGTLKSDCFELKAS